MILDDELLQNLAALPVEKRAITNPRVLNEAYDYAKPSSFVRGMRIDLNGLTILLISGSRRCGRCVPARRCLLSRRSAGW